MKGFTPLFLGIIGTFVFSWAGLALIPNFQIGHLEPQSDEEATDIYPMPKSGMADRGRQIYAANGCIYCHTQQVRADYAGSDIDRKWGERRSAPRDYIYERPAVLGQMRMGPDLANVGKRAPSSDQNAPTPGASPSSGATAPPAGAAGSPAASPAAAGKTSPAPAPGQPPAPSPAPTVSAAPAASPGVSPAVANSPSPAARGASAAPAPGNPPQASATSAAPTNAAVTAASSSDTMIGPDGKPIPYTAAWHHVHLYSPRSINLDSTMPAYRFLYEKRRVEGEPASDALKLTGDDAPAAGWEIVPTYDAKCLVAYLMSLDQSHPLNEVKSTTPPSPPAPAKKGP